MNESEGYVVYFFPQALEALGDAIKPYLREGPGGEHVLCHEIDTAGSLVEMTIEATTPQGRAVSLELMVPQAMVKMVVSARSDAAFGFSPRVAPGLMAALPPVAGDAPAPDAPTHAVPQSVDTPVSAPAPAKAAPAAAAAPATAAPAPGGTPPTAEIDESKLPPEG